MVAVGTNLNVDHPPVDIMNDRISDEVRQCLPQQHMVTFDNCRRQLCADSQVFRSHLLLQGRQRLAHDVREIHKFTIERPHLCV